MYLSFYGHLRNTDGSAEWDFFPTRNKLKAGNYFQVTRVIIYAENVFLLHWQGILHTKQARKIQFTDRYFVLKSRRFGHCNLPSAWETFFFSIEIVVKCVWDV